MIKATILSGCLLLALANPSKAADFYQSYGPPGGYYDVPGTSYSYQMAEMVCGPYGCRERYRSDQGEGYGRPYGRPYYGDRYRGDDWRGGGYNNPPYGGGYRRNCFWAGGVRVCN